MSDLEDINEFGQRVFKERAKPLKDKYDSGIFDYDQYVKALNDLKVTIGNEERKTRNNKRVQAAIQPVLDEYMVEAKEVKNIADKEREAEDFTKELIQYAKDSHQEQVDFALEERNYTRGLAEKADREKQVIADEMLAESDITKDEYDTEIGKATSDVKQAFASGSDANIRDARRMGLNPNSGRFKAMDRGREIAEAATTAGAQNQTRMNLKSFSENKKDNARRVKLGLNPLALGTVDRRIGMNDPTMGALQSGAGFYANSSARLQSQQNFNRGMELDWARFNKIPDPPSFTEQLIAGGVGGVVQAGTAWGLKKYGG